MAVVQIKRMKKSATAIQFCTQAGSWNESCWTFHVENESMMKHSVSRPKVDIILSWTVATQGKPNRSTGLLANIYRFANVKS